MARLGRNKVVVKVQDLGRADGKPAFPAMCPALALQVFLGHRLRSL